MAKLGTRFPVKIPCKNPDLGNQYALVTKSVIEFFGMEIASNPTAGTRKGKKGASQQTGTTQTGTTRRPGARFSRSKRGSSSRQRSSTKDPTTRPVAGSSKGGSIKIPVDADGTKFKSMPVPSGATNEDLRIFCNALKRNKPAFFISPQGVRVFLEKKAGTGNQP